MIKGIIFDFDGTIIDSETPTFDAWANVYKQYGQVLPQELWRTIIGTADGKFQPAEYLFNKLQKNVSLDEIRQLAAQTEKELLAAIPPLPGVVDYLKSAREMGIKLGISSSGTSDWVRGNLERLQLSDYFEAITTQEEVQLTKPYPYLFEKTTKKLGLFPYQVIAIEDSPLGVTAAQAAGIFTVAVPNAVTCDMNLSHADMVLASLAEVSLPDLITKITSE